MRPTVEVSMINRPLAALSAMFIALTTGITLSQPAQASPTPPPDPALKQTVSDNELSLIHI